MNTKIQGGGDGKYANKSSCIGVVSYLGHEDFERMEEGQSPEHFFNQDNDRVSAREVTDKIDQNKAKLCKKDAKFFMLTVSPSAEELAKMGKTPEQQSAAMKDYIRDEVIAKYAQNFGKDLNADDIEYYAKIHHKRPNKEDNNLHAHIIISRKDKANKIKLSPQTNHRSKGNGAVKSGFDRSAFYKKVESAFDDKFSYNRDIKKSFEYLNTLKNGTLEQIREQSAKVIDQERTPKKGLEQYLREGKEKKQEKTRGIEL